MTVYVDELKVYRTEQIQPAARRWGTRWAHLTCGGDCEELHAFAESIGMRREWAQHMDKSDHYFHHYDLVPTRHAKALKAGAVFKPIREQAAEYNARLNGHPELLP